MSIDHKVSLMLTGSYSDEFINNVKFGLKLKRFLENYVKNSPDKYSGFREDIGSYTFAENLLKEFSS